MPASLLYEFEPQANFSKHHHSSSLHHSSHHNGSNGAAAQLEDRRAFELALELSLLGLGTDNNNSSSSSNGLLNGHHHQQSHHQQHHNSEQNLSATIASLGSALMGGPASGGLLGQQQQQQQQQPQQQHMAHPLNPFESESRIGAKKSQNTTECVPVPSSEHVAEIVGRQGCKIKALRSKTNTYIKTPVRGEEPVFVVTGRKEDVGAAKREILSAAEHFSQIRAQRKNNPGSVGPAPNAHLPGHVTASVRVPYRVVGLVVGPKGATIKRIQQQTNTYIITPSREKDPVFEVTGLPEDVDTARKEIEAHIAIRTGGVIGANGEGSGSGSGSVGTPEESGCGSSGSGSSDHFSNGSPLLLSSCLESALNGMASAGGGGLNSFSAAQSVASALTDAFASYGKSTTTTTSSSSDPFSQGGPHFFGSNSSGIHSASGSSLLSNSPTDSVFVGGGSSGNGLNGNHHLHGQNVQAAAKFTDLYSIFSAGGKAATCYDTDESGLGDSPPYGSGLIHSAGPHQGTWSDFSTGARSNYVFSTLGNGGMAGGEDSLEVHRRSSSLESNSSASASSSSTSSSSISPPSTAAILL